MASAQEIKKYLVQVCQQPLNVEVRLEVAIGTGYNTVQRMRVELSRVRKRLESKRHHIQRFKLYSRVEYGIKSDMETIVFIRTPEGGSPPVDMSDLEKMLAVEGH